MTCYEDYNVVSHNQSIGQRASGFFGKGFQVAKRFAKNRITGFKTRRQQRLDRQLFKQLHQLEDHVLDDIGVTRGDIDWASNLPTSINASEAVNSIKEENRQSRLRTARPKRRH